MVDLDDTDLSVELRLGKKIAQWRSDPVAFVYDMFGAGKPGLKVQDFQKAALESFRDNHRTAMGASKGVGKSTTMAWAAWWQMVCYRDANIFMGSKSEKNLVTGMWKELAVWYSRSVYIKNMFKMGGRKAYLIESPHTHFIQQVTYPKNATVEERAEAFAGKHAPVISFLMDETGGEAEEVMTSAEAILTQTDVELARIMQAGNTTQRKGALWNASPQGKHSKYWNWIPISGDPEDPKRSTNVSIQWAREEIEKHGRDNPYVMINVLGKFPKTSVSSLLSAADVEEAILRDLPLAHTMAGMRSRIGIDMARKGDDSTAIIGRKENIVYPPVELRAANTQEVVSAVHSMINSYFRGESPFIFVDGTGGFGSGVVDFMRSIGMDVAEVHFSAHALDREHYQNIRAEMWTKMAEQVKRSVSLKSAFGDLENSAGKRFAEDCEATEWFINEKSGKRQLLDKDQIRKVLKRSPDIGDALALTYSRPETLDVGKDSLPGRVIQGPEYNPYDYSGEY